MPAAAETPWEKAYREFETPEQEIRKFMRRLDSAGAASWPRDARIVELFCGRGNGLRALERFGFTRLEGVDLSETLLAQYTGSARLYVGDCRELQFPDASRDLAIVQGGLHHLPTLPDDLERTLAEILRVVRPGGRVMFVEPWSTPFLTAVHALCRMGVVRRLWARLDNLATMIEHERETYEAWLARPGEILALLDECFERERVSIGLGKINFVGRPRS